MPATTTLLAFSLIALGLVLTPGPNMIYLMSRAICQGRQAAFVSLGGVALAFVFYLCASAAGISALLFAVPFAYDALRLAGASYLAWLAWQSLKPGSRSAFQVRELAPDSNRRLFVMGFMTNLLNPKAAMLYLSLLPQFIDPAQGSVLAQSMVLGLLQIAISMSVNAAIIFVAAAIAMLLHTRPTLAVVQRWMMGTVLGGLALRMALDVRR